MNKPNTVIGNITTAGSLCTITASGNTGSSGSITLNSPYVFSDISSTTSTTSTNALDVKGKATFEDDVTFEKDITVNGKKLSATLEKIEQRLAILNYNTELEKQWKSLRELGEQYRSLEMELIAKELMLKKLST